MKEQYVLLMRYKQSKMTVREYLDFSKHILLGLANFDPIFSNLIGSGSNSKSKSGFDSNLSNFNEIVMNQIKDEQLSYINEDLSNQEMNLESKSYVDFMNLYSNNSKVEDGKITITISCGGILSEESDLGIFNIHFPVLNQPKFTSLSFCRDLLSKCIEIVDLEYATIISSDFMMKSRIDSCFMSVGWITYIKHREIQLMLPKSVEYEDFHKGTLIELSQSIIYSDDTDKVELAKMLNQRFIENNIF